MKIKTISKPPLTFYSDFVISEGFLYAIFEKLDNRVQTIKVGKVKNNYISDFVETINNIKFKYE